MGDWLRPIDQYCERTDPGLWSEPLNALSNIAFFIAAALLWQRSGGDRIQRGFAVLIALVGLGSLAFHTFAQAWASVLDVLFIAMFIYAFVGVFVHRIAGAPVWGALAGMGAYWALGAVLGLAVPSSSWNGTAAYLPAWTGLCLMAGYLAYRRDARVRRYLLAISVLGASMLLRTFDSGVCDAFPFGTHFLWHLLNGWLLYLLAGSLGRPAPVAPRT